MSSYSHFTMLDRICLHLFLSWGLSQRAIAKLLDKNPSSVSREIHRNRTYKNPKKPPNNPYWYNCERANILASVRKKNCGRRRRALVPGTIEYQYVVEKLSMFWSPEQIAHRMEMDLPGHHVSTSTIYRHLKAGLLEGVSCKKSLRRRAKRPKKRNSNFNTIHPDRTIPQWPEEIVHRSSIRNWEGDTVYGGIGKGLMVTLDDRKSRFLKARRILSRNATETRKAIESLLQEEPCLSVSLDNGSEFSEFHELEKSLDTLVYFAEPHKPWQRGTNENTNDILRFFFPKGYDFRFLSDEELQEVVDLINNRPRKCLGWKTPKEVFEAEKSVALA